MRLVSGLQKGQSLASAVTSKDVHQGTLVNSIAVSLQQAEPTLSMSDAALPARNANHLVVGLYWAWHKEGAHVSDPRCPAYVPERAIEMPSTQDQRTVAARPHPGSVTPSSSSESRRSCGSR